MTLKTKIKHIYQRINGCTIEYDLSHYYAILAETLMLKDQIKNGSPILLTSG